MQPSQEIVHPKAGHERISFVEIADFAPVREPTRADNSFSRAWLRGNSLPEGAISLGLETTFALCFLGADGLI